MNFRDKKLQMTLLIGHLQNQAKVNKTW